MTDISIKLIKNYSVYHKLLSIIMIAITMISRIMNYSKYTVSCNVFAIIAFVFMVLDSVFYYKGVYMKNMGLLSVLRYLEILTYGIFATFLPADNVLLIAVFLILYVLTMEYIILGSHYDKSTIGGRKIALLIPFFVNMCLSLQFRGEEFWICSFLVLFIFVIVVLFMCEFVVYAFDSYESYSTKLVFERDEMLEKNEQLEEYKDKIETVNERVNYQKIELARVVSDLEQANREIESQTEVMRYMASSFDIGKNLHVILDAIMDVKKPKVCGVYLEDMISLEHLETCIIKTDYDALERRLRKDFSKIYRDFSESGKTSEIITGPELNEYRFIGETNIRSLAFLALIEDQKQYGLMLVASEQDNFFKKGITYYETCLMEFNVSVKSSRLYLQTQNMARKDGLTQIYNRVYFGELFKEASDDAKQMQQSLAVALFDIDKFKHVNDTYGHLAGDKVIKMVASVDEKYAKQYGGFACRYGGEEFLLVLPGCDEKTALPILESMHEEIRNTVVDYETQSIHVNVCIGLSAFPTLCSNTDVLVSRADKAMYYGKKHGRGRLVIDNPSIDEAS